MLTLDAIVPLYQRHENTFALLHRLLVASTRPPDFVTLVCEGEGDWMVAKGALAELYEMELIDSQRGVSVSWYPTPRVDADGPYRQIPYSRKINYALDLSIADLAVYVDNGSMPHEDKFETMVRDLEENPEWGAVYCSQHRTGFRDETHLALGVIDDGYGQVNFTQVMHRLPVEARWTLDMQYANPDLADAIFWRDLHKELGPFYPSGGDKVLDEHWMPTPAATL